MKLKFGKARYDEDPSAGYWGGEEDYNGGFGGETANMDGIVEEAPAAASAAPVGGSAYGASNGGVEMKIFTPRSVEDGEEIASLLASGKTVLLNMESIEREDVVRLMDFLRGATYMVDGGITRVSRTSIVVSPKSVDISVIEAMAGGEE
jgi:cell division inhibitor SepF